LTGMTKLCIKFALAAAMTFLASSVTGLIRWIYHLSEWTWMMKGYFPLFILLFYLIAIPLYYYSFAKKLKRTPLLFLFLLSGWVSSFCAYIGASIFQPEGVARLLNSFELLGLWIFVALPILPIPLLGWLYGGIFGGSLILIDVVTSRIGKED
jgi:hypothetical protein